MLLTATVVQCRREDVPLWKSSVLALIYHGVDELCARGNPVTEHLSGMEAVAKTTDVQLVKGEDAISSLSTRTGYDAVAQDM